MLTGSHFYSTGLLEIAVGEGGEGSGQSDLRSCIGLNVVQSDDRFNKRLRSCLDRLCSHLSKYSAAGISGVGVPRSRTVSDGGYFFPNVNHQVPEFLACITSLTVSVLAHPPSIEPPAGQSHQTALPIVTIP